MKKNQIEAYLFSIAGVAAMGVIAIAIYVISGLFNQRLDLTEEKIYTLSPGTKAIVEKLDTPVEIRFYYTHDSRDMPVVLKTYAQRIEDLLGEYKKLAGDKLDIKKFDPKPDTDAEDAANLDGVEGQMAPSGDKIYLGLAISQLDKRVAIPFLSPEREKLLEYDISRAIARATTDDQPVVGVMSALSVFGQFNPMMMRMGQMQRQDPWVFVSELQRDFQVREVEMTVEEIPSDIDVLVVVHPKNISDKAQFAIDQFVLRGGKLVAFVDPLSLVDSHSNPQMNPMQASMSGGSSLDKLLKAWGLEFDQNKVVADLNFITRIDRGGREEPAPAVLSVTGEALNPDDVVTSELDNMLIPFAGAFSGTPAEGLKQDVLLESSPESQLVERFMAEFSGQEVLKNFSASGKKHPIAVRLTGKFKTAFPEGKPKDAANTDDKEADQPAEIAALKESTTDGVVVLVGDTDFLYDQFAVFIRPILGQRIIIPRNQNLNFVQSTVEQLAGDANLISIRSRATMNRPFTLVRTLQAQAEDRYRQKIKELEQSLADTQARLNELQQAKESGQRFILSPEQQAELKKFQEKQVQVNRELRQERRNLRKEIDSLENRLKWVNIAGMPFLVALSGLSLALVKRRKTAAK